MDVTGTEEALSRGAPSAMERREEDAARSNNDCADAAADERLRQPNEGKWNSIM